MGDTNLNAKGLMPSLTVNDLAASLRFYTEGLGFAVTQEWKEGEKVMGAMLNAGEKAGIGIGQDDFAKGKDRVKGVGISLYFETDQDIDVLAKKAIAAGIKMQSGPGALPWGPKGFAVNDPDGFRITIANPQ